MPRPNETTSESTAPLSSAALDPANTPPIEGTSTNKIEETKRTGMGFMDLPAEIRTEIYGYVLEEEAPIQLEIRRAEGGREVCRRGAAAKWRRNREYDKATGTFIELPFKHTSILYTSKQLLLEASAVLYGNDILSFQRITVLRDFLETIGDKRAQHLRHIRIEARGYVRNSIRGALEMLCAATSLCKLDFSHLDVCRGTGYRDVTFSLEGLADDCKTLAKALEKSYAKRGVNRSATDVFSVHVPECEMYHGATSLPHQWTLLHRGWEHCECECAEIHGKNDELEKKFRAEIAKHLEGSNSTE